MLFILLCDWRGIGLFHILIKKERKSHLVFSKPCGIRAARKLRVVRRQERWADKVIVVFLVG